MASSDSQIENHNVGALKELLKLPDVNISTGVQSIYTEKALKPVGKSPCCLTHT